MQAITLDVIMRTIFGVGDGCRRLDALRDALVQLHDARHVAARHGDPAAHAARATPSRCRAGAAGSAAAAVGAARARAGRDRSAGARPDRARRREGTAGREDILSMLLEARDEHGQPMTDDQLRDEMLTLLVAGHETTATTLAWTLHHLLEHPSGSRGCAPRLARSARDGARQARPARRGDQGDAAADADHPDGRRAARAADDDRRRRLAARVGRARVIYLVHRRADLWPEPNELRSGAVRRQEGRSDALLPVRRRRAALPGHGVRDYEMKIVLATILARVGPRGGAGQAVKLVRRGITFAPSGGMPLVVRRRV